jgi:SAM-dependent methyltransferase
MTDSVTDLAGRIIGHYEKHAIAWDADRRNSGWNDRRWHDRFVEALPKSARVLDLGCGGGIPVARNLADHALRVTGIDSSPAIFPYAVQGPRRGITAASLRFISHGKHDIQLSGGAARLGFRYAAHDRTHARHFSCASHKAKASL